ncbi:hypothetical protein CAEBREN_18709 [Caenorhabditis brenneri]|uniref:Uncharacterized protein n=1 Tax=Caenorhabditis brenneri TaxID=135651 RepID=G0N690_CAEBE|nr:hypothetical protein CAEBREN_18709 [Caenorhabditis brenneri]
MEKSDKTTQLIAFETNVVAFELQADTIGLRLITGEAHLVANLSSIEFTWSLEPPEDWSRGSGNGLENYWEYFQFSN